MFATFMLQNLRDSANRIKDWLDRRGKAHISDHDLTIYQMLSDAQKELENAS